MARGAFAAALAALRLLDSAHNQDRRPRYGTDR